MNMNGFARREMARRVFAPLQKVVAQDGFIGGEHLRKFIAATALAHEIPLLARSTPAFAGVAGLMVFRYARGLSSGRKMRAMT